LDEKLILISSQNTGDNRDLKLQKLKEIYALVSPLGSELEATERIIEHAKILGLSSDPTIITDSYQQFLKGKDLRKNFPAPASPIMDIVEEMAPPLPPVLTLANVPWPEGASFLFKQIFTHPELISTNYFADILKLVYNDPFRAFLIKLKFIFAESTEETEAFHQTVMDFLEQTPELVDWKSKISDIIFSCRPQSLTEKGLHRTGSDLQMRWKLLVWQQEIEVLLALSKAPLQQKELDEIYDKIFKLKISVNVLMNQLKKSPLRLSSSADQNTELSAPETK
jgi:hypothetical protein